MWKVYLRQIVRLLRENKFFSVVYILGTALSVAMIMLILVTYHIKSGDIGVEDRRSRTAYVIRGYAVPEGATACSTAIRSNVTSKSRPPIPTLPSGASSPCASSKDTASARPT